MYVSPAVSYVVSTLLDADAFVPFEVVIADGRLIAVRNKGDAWLEHDGDLLYVVAERPTGGQMTEVVVTSHIALVRVSGRFGPVA